MLTPEQANYTEPVNPALLRHLLDTNHDDINYYVDASM